MGKLEDLKKHLEKDNKAVEQEYGFKVPDGYFETLSERITAQVSENQQITRIIPWTKIMTMAASICLVLSAAVWMMKPNADPGNLQVAMNDVSSEESMKYLLESEVDNISTDDMLELDNIDEILSELEEEYLNH